MSESTTKYGVTTTIETYGGKVFTSEEEVSQYDWNDGFLLSSEQVIADMPVSIELGNGNSIQIRPSDILFIKNNKREINPNEGEKESLNE